MDEQSENQQDLFDSDLNEGNSTHLKDLLKFRKSRNWTFSSELGTAFVAIGLALLVMFFYFGFQRGQIVAEDRIADKIMLYRMQLTENKEDASYSHANKKAPKTQQSPEYGTPSARNESIVKSGRKPYTIQIITYRNEAKAVKAVSQLTKQGYLARYIVQGAMYAVCIGEYSNRLESQKDMGTLRRTYPDCFLRKF